MFTLLTSILAMAVSQTPLSTWPEQALESENVRSANLITERLWDLDQPTMPSYAAADEDFGSAFAKGDFNGDGIQDLAVGIPGWNTTHDNAGAVLVMYGSSNSLTGTGSTLLFQSADSNDGDAAREENDRFGTSLAAGDFNNDGYDDLAVGSPREDIQFFDDAGAVHVFHGSQTGVSTVHNNFLVVGAVVLNEVGSNDSFGEDIVVGDFNNDGFSDLAVSIPNRNISFNNTLIISAGEVRVFFGSVTGLSSTFQSLTQ